MRKFGVGIVTVVFAVAPASADVYRTHVTGFGVVTTFHTISDDTCVETSGELAAVSTPEGTFGFVIADRTDYCAEGGPVDWSYAWIEPVAFSANGLSSATLTGSFVMSPYAGPTGDELTLDFALAFTGTGAVSTTTSHFRSTSPDDTTLFFSAAHQRAATVSGSLSAGGDDGGVTSAQIVGGTEGELVVIH